MTHRVHGVGTLIEGDYVETRGNLIFTVKGLIHPPNMAVAFLRYVPDPNGDRIRNGVKFRRIKSLKESFTEARRLCPNYVMEDPFFGRTIQAVPLRDAAVVYLPRQRLKAILKEGASDCVEEAASKLALELSDESGVPTDRMGVSGSTLLGLHRSNSDVDMTVYGVREGAEVYRALRGLVGRRGVSAHRGRLLEEACRFRWGSNSPIPFQALMRVEARKVLQGLVDGRGYFLRLVPEPWEFGERYGEAVYRRVGRCRIKAVVSDDSWAVYTPCLYRVEDVKVLWGVEAEVSELQSFRGRFTEQAWAGETVYAEGTLEAVYRDGEVFYRLVLEGGRDFMVPVWALKGSRSPEQPTPP